MDFLSAAVKCFCVTSWDAELRNNKGYVCRRCSHSRIVDGNCSLLADWIFQRPNTASALSHPSSPTFITMAIMKRINHGPWRPEHPLIATMDCPLIWRPIKLSQETTILLSDSDRLAREVYSVAPLARIILRNRLSSVAYHCRPPVVNMIAAT